MISGTGGYLSAILRLVLRAGILFAGGLAVWLAFKAQGFWSPLEINEKQWEPGYQLYIRALLVFGIFLFFSIYIPFILRWWRGSESYADPVPNWRIPWFLGILGFAFVIWLAQSLRFYDLETVPPELWLDEGINVMDAEKIRETGQHSIYLHSMSTQRTALFVEILAQTLNLDWPSRVYAVRGTAAILGFINVALFFLLGWRMVSAQFGLLIDFLMATSHWHLNYSRWGMEQILSPLFEVGALAFFFAAYSLGSLRETPSNEGHPEKIQRFYSLGKQSLSVFLYILAGLCLGGGIYAYSNFRLFLVGVAIFFVLLPLNWLGRFRQAPRWFLSAVGLGVVSLLALGLVYYLGRNAYHTLDAAKQLPVVNGRTIAPVQFLVQTKGWFLLPCLIGLFVAYLLIWRIVRTDWFGFGLMVVVAAVVLIPFLQASLQDWYAFTKRASETSVFNGPNYMIPLKQEATRTLLGMHWVGDQNGRHNLTLAPQLALIPAAMSVLGLLYGLMTIFRPVSRLLLLWVFFGLLPGMVTWEAPHASRMLDALPPLLILAALAWREVYHAIARIPWIGYGIAVIATLIGCVAVYKDDYRLYFIERPASREVYESFLPDEVYAAKYAGQIPRDVALYVDPQLHSKHNFWFYQGPQTKDDFRKVSKFDVGTMPIADIPAAQACFVVMRSGEGLVNWLAELYPKAKVVVGRSPWGQFNFAAVHVTREQVQETYQRFQNGQLHLKHGLLAKYFVENEVTVQRDVPRLLDWNLLDATGGRPPTRVTWDGYVWKKEPGVWHFGTHPQNVTVTIGGIPWVRGRGAGSREDGQYVTKDLKRGLHPFHAEYDHGPSVRVPYFVWMMWRAPGANLPNATPFPSEFFSPALQ